MHFKDNSSSIRHSDLLKKSCESLLESQSSYLKWLIMSTIGSEEDAVKNYFNLGKAIDFCFYLRTGSKLSDEELN